ncbi:MULTISPECIES: DUF3088 family protein [Sphingomonadaceae]|uniref:DUF3088 family protein n=1 Tax=Sphingomonadaceae TaxID=41297 RepID=UPI0011579E7C|nr:MULTISPECIES: DUF3088 family protein [Sphingomonadaceae]QDK34619.1 hypothetical protein DM450_17920 [Sphingomonas sp. IC081]QSR16613.1 hypothetical protein CA833_05345 [Novosphingobium sp. KA1]
MAKDTLFVLDFDYADPALGGERRFYCKDCVTVEGLLALFPERAGNIEVVRVGWPRPRAAVVAMLGEANQNLPALAFAEGGFAGDIEGVLAALHTRHGFPERHP